MPIKSAGYCDVISQRNKWELEGQTVANRIFMTTLKLMTPEQDSEFTF